MRKTFFALTLLLFCFFSVKAQSLPVGTLVLEDAYRREQLLGDFDSTVSFTIRPLFSSILNKKSLFYPDSSSTSESLIRFKGSIYSKKNKSGIQLLPVTLLQQYNTKVPYGWNDGAMISARGYQTLFSAGFFAKVGPVSIQLRPEFVFAENRSFTGYAEGKSLNNIASYYGYYNNMDIPERFGTKSYSKALWGQSSIRLTFDPVSIGLSTENLWWGPGMRNSLLMSNTGQGFKHLTLNTTRPVNTPLGYFEAQIIAGRLEGSGFTPLTPNIDQFYVPKDPDWRYLSAMVFTYHPKWVPGLFLGFTRSFQVYNKDMGGGLNDYFPLLSAFQKENVLDEDTKRRDQLTSFFARWAFTKAKAEVYFEYGLNDHSYNLRDFIMSPEHSRAYIFGMRKLVPIISRKNEYIQVKAEVTQMQQSIDRIIRGAGAWYMHGQIFQGYTNKGEVLGAGIGPGSNLQSFDFSWIRGLKTIGLQVERYQHNNDFYNAAFADNQANSLQKNWVDLSASAHSEWNYKNLLLTANLQMIRSINYQWYNQIASVDEFYIPDNDIYNFNFKLGITYRF